jgi:hypothetical protein
VVGDFWVIRNGRKKLRQKLHRTGFSLLALPLLLAGALSGCEHIGKARPVPLYPDPAEPRPPESLAHLQGPIAEVGGIDVEPYGTVFDLLPGCHVVTLRRKVGEGSVSGAWMVDLGTVIYTFHMRPGFLYTIDVSVRFRGSSHGSMTITARTRSKGAWGGRSDGRDRGAGPGCGDDRLPDGEPSLPISVSRRTTGAPWPDLCPTQRLRALVRPAGPCSERRWATSSHAPAARERESAARAVPETCSRAEVLTT